MTYEVQMDLNDKTAEQTSLLHEAGAGAQAVEAQQYPKKRRRVVRRTERNESNTGAEVVAKIEDEVSQRDLNEKLLDALEYGRNKELFKEFIEAGADVNACDWRGNRTALMKAYTSEQTKLLLEAGADVNAKDRCGKTALMYAQTAEQIKLLLDAGADVNAKDNEGNTALANLLSCNVWYNPRIERVAVDDFGHGKAKEALEMAKVLLEAGVSLEGKCWVMAGDYNGFNLSVVKVLSELDEPLLMKTIYTKVRNPDCIRKHIEERKANIKKSCQKRKRIEKQNPMEKVSGVGLADEIARDVILGKETRTITPEIGMAIKRKKAFEK